MAGIQKEKKLPDACCNLTFYLGNEIIQVEKRDKKCKCINCLRKYDTVGLIIPFHPTGIIDVILSKSTN